MKTEQHIVNGISYPAIVLNRRELAENRTLVDKLRDNGFVNFNFGTRSEVTLEHVSFVVSKVIWTPPKMLIIDDRTKQLRPMGGSERELCEKLKLGTFDEQVVRYYVETAVVRWRELDASTIVIGIEEFRKENFTT